ncbi:MAG: arabinogalactan endo-1,4-beta-galactosidase [Saprospiraceae bacterium]|jgi:arabinogalactan endo-1,4-beta-galactosidase
MKYIFFLFILALFFACNNDNITPTPEPEPTPEPLPFDYIRGVDISFLPEIETTSTSFYNEDGESKDALTILKEAGCNTIRIRLWHSPSSAHSSFSEVNTFAKRVHDANLKVWLTVHYSDIWADPGSQTIPTPWQGLNLDTMKDSLSNYTQRIVQEMNPDFIQIGNETNDGFLWNIGKPQNSYYELLKTACTAVRATSDSCKIMIHYAGTNGADYFFSNLQNEQIDYDLIGISYYPMWHGKNLDALSNNLKLLKDNYNHPVVIAETAYPFTLDWDDWTNNILGSDEHLIDEYPATPTGQTDFLRKIKEISIRNDNFGFCYWGTEWISFRGNQANNGSTWENQALFDFNNKALPAMQVLGE